MKRKLAARRLWALLLVCAMSLSCALTASAQSAKAASMQLMKTEGTVHVSNNTGKDLPLLEKMRLYNGYTITTGAASYAWINLDDTKLIKMDALSQISVHKSGKKLEVRVDSGMLFFDISEPLADDETLNIRTSTTIVGIRGTSGYFGYNSLRTKSNLHMVNSPGEIQLGVTDGKVICRIPNMKSSQVVKNGQGIKLEVNSHIAPTPTKITAVDIPGFAAMQIASNPDLAQRVESATGLKIPKEAAKTELISDQKTVQQALDIIKSQMPKNVNISTSPVWGESSFPPAAETSPASSKSEKPSSSEASDADESSSSSPPVSSELTMPVSASEIQEALDVHDRVRVD